MIDASPRQEIQRHLGRLDEAVRTGEFRASLSAVDYETRLWQALERLDAAHYHVGNALRILPEYGKPPFVDPPVDEVFNVPGARMIETLAGSNHTKYEERLTFEVTAFLAALKSALDFFITALASRWGVKKGLDSVRRALEFSKGRPDPIARFLARWKTELENLQSYRNALIHRTSLRVTVRVTSRTLNSIHSSATLAVVQGQPPKLVQFTRALARRGDDLQFGEESSKGTVSEDGKTRVASYQVRLLPPPGFVRLNDFMSEKLDWVGTFIVEGVRVLDAGLPPPGGREVGESAPQS